MKLSLPGSTIFIQRQKTPESFLKNLTIILHTQKQIISPFIFDIMEQLKWKLWILLGFQKATSHILKSQRQG